MGASGTARRAILRRFNFVIFISVGTQLPFDRLIRIMDELAPDLPAPVFAQTCGGSYRPSNIDWRASLSLAEFEYAMRLATVTVAHAGIGTVITAQRMRRPLVLFPRRADLNEHRNDHQRATARALQGRPGVAIAWDAADLREYVLYPGRIASHQIGTSLTAERLKAMLKDRLSAASRNAAKVAS